MTAISPSVRVRGLRKVYRPDRYREVAALNGLDLDIDTGEIVALLGPNGAGKTTAVQILTGYRRRDAGEVAVLGADPAGAGRGWRARIGIVPQKASDFGELTVLEVLRHLAGYYPGGHPMTALPSTPAPPGPPAPASPAPSQLALPSLLRTSLSRGRLEVTSFFRDRESVIFTFSLPVILLVVFGEVFHGTIGSTGVAFRQYFTA